MTQAVSWLSRSVLLFTSVLIAELGNAADFSPAVSVPNKFPPLPLADQVAVFIQPTWSTGTIGEEMVAVLEIKNVSPDSVRMLHWQPYGDRSINTEWRLWHIYRLSLVVAEPFASQHGIKLKIPNVGGTAPMVILSPGQTKQAGVRIDEYLLFTQPIDEPVIITWTLELQKGQVKTGKFPIRIVAAKDPLAEQREQNEQTADAGLRAELEQYGVESAP